MQPTGRIAARFRWVVLVAGLALVIALAPACARHPYHAIDLRRAIAHGDPIRVTMKDGRIFGLNNPVVANDSLRGTVIAKPPVDLAVAVTDVLRVERMKSGPKAMIAIAAGAALAFILISTGVIGFGPVF